MKKVLIITYYWPPAGGPGVQRWLKFVKYLRDFNVEPVVYVPENPHYPLTDKTLHEEIPKGIEVLKKRIFEPYGLAGIFSQKETKEISSGLIPEEGKQDFLQKAMLYIRGNFFIPDARKFWVKPSVKFLSKYLKESGIKTIITTGPPHSLHLIGLELKQTLGIKWIADFRDPWTNIGYHEKLKLTKKNERTHYELEKEVLTNADEIITTSYTTRDEFAGKTSRPISVITNGYDVVKAEKPELDKEFSLAHIGSLLAGRSPENLWKALSELVAENTDFAKDFKLKLIGAVGEGVLERIREAGLEPWTELYGYRSHEEVLVLQRSAQMLLLIEIDSEKTRGIIPGKLFEYMVSQRPILAVGPENADIQKIIRETNTGKFFEYPQKDEIKDYLLKSYQAYKKEGIKTSPIGLQKYSRKALTGELAKLLN